jgi:hypothetical protein
VDNFIKSTTTFEEVDAIVEGAIIGAGRGTVKDADSNNRMHLLSAAPCLPGGREEEERVRRAREEEERVRRGGEERVRRGYVMEFVAPSKVGQPDEPIKDVLARTMGPQAKGAQSEMQDKFRAKMAQKRANGRT